MKVTDSKGQKFGEIQESLYLSRKAATLAYRLEL